MKDFGQCECHKTTPNECPSCIDWKANQERGVGTLCIEIDASAVQEAIDKEMKSLGVLGEVARTKLVPTSMGMLDRIETVYRRAYIFHFDRKTGPQYRQSLLDIAALAVSAIEQFDQEIAHEQHG